MAEKKKSIRFELTEEQKRQVREATGKDAKTVELTIEDLEQRVSPAIVSLKAEARLT